VGVAVETKSTVKKILLLLCLVCGHYAIDKFDPHSLQVAPHLLGVGGGDVLPRPVTVVLEGLQGHPHRRVDLEAAAKSHLQETVFTSLILFSIDGGFRSHGERKVPAAVGSPFPETL